MEPQHPQHLNQALTFLNGKLFHLLAETSTHFNSIFEVSLNHPQLFS